MPTAVTHNLRRRKCPRPVLASGLPSMPRCRHRYDNTCQGQHPRVPPLILSADYARRAVTGPIWYARCRHPHDLRRRQSPRKLKIDSNESRRYGLARVTCHLHRGRWKTHPGCVVPCGGGTPVGDHWFASRHACADANLPATAVQFRERGAGSP